jgi:hypothetical protein
MGSAPIYPFDGGSCAIVDQIRAWITSHQSCNTDTDCMSEQK